MNETPALQSVKIVGFIAVVPVMQYLAIFIWWEWPCSKLLGGRGCRTPATSIMSVLVYRLSRSIISQEIGGLDYSLVLQEVEDPWAPCSFQ